MRHLKTSQGDRRIAVATSCGGNSGDISHSLKRDEVTNLTKKKKNRNSPVATASQYSRQCYSDVVIGPLVHWSELSESFQVRYVLHFLFFSCPELPCWRIWEADAIAPSPKAQFNAKTAQEWLNTHDSSFLISLTRPIL